MLCNVNCYLISCNSYEDVSGALDGGADGLEIIVSILRNTKYLLNKQG